MERSCVDARLADAAMKSDRDAVRFLVKRGQGNAPQADGAVSSIILGIVNSASFQMRVKQEAKP